METEPNHEIRALGAELKREIAEVRIEVKNLRAHVSDTATQQLKLLCWVFLALVIIMSVLAGAVR